MIKSPLSILFRVCQLQWLLLLSLAFVTSPTIAAPGDRDLACQLAAVKRAFYENEVVPDVLPFFDPQALAYVSFDYKNGSEPEVLLFPGLKIGRNDSQTTPTILLKGITTKKRSKYLAVLVDPDAPSRANPIRRNFRHYLATDLTLTPYASESPHLLALTNSTEDGVPAHTFYAGPAPPPGSGPHRYVLFVYEQPLGGVDLSRLNATDRASFNLTAFAAEQQLGGAIAGTWWETEVAAVSNQTAAIV